MRLATLVLMFVFSCGAAAQEAKPKPAPVPGVAPHWYGGVAIGQTILDLTDDALPAPGATDSGLNKGQNRSGYKGFVGYRLHRHFALEGGYTDYGRFKATRTVNAPTQGDLIAEISIRGWSLDGIVVYPFANGFSVFAKGGGLYATTSTTYTTTGSYTLPAGSYRNSRSRELVAKYGIGGGYAFNDRVSLRLDYEIAKKVGEDTTIEGDVKGLFLGLQARFF
jgi:hypothetical protein